MKVMVSIISVAFMTVVCAGCKDEKTSTEISGNRIVKGVVILKEHHDTVYLNPVDNIDPMRNVDPVFNYKKGRIATATPEKNLVYVQLDEKTSIVTDSKSLFASVEKGSQVKVELAEEYEVSTNRQGVILNRVFKGSVVVKVTPE